MSSRNDGGEMMGIVIVITIVVTIMMFVFFVLYALLLFAALIFTILSLLAWKRPLRFGSHSLEPREAHAFVARGIIGTFLLPAFGMFCEFLFEMQIEKDLWPHLFMAGYALGSVGVEILMAQNEESNTTNVMMPPPQFSAPPRRPQSLPPAEPFRFATWDDEERDE